MDIAGLFRESIDIAKRNYLLFVPTIAVAVVMLVLSLILVAAGVLSIGVMGGMQSPAGVAGAVGSFVGGLFFVAVVGGVLGLFAHGVTIGMAKEAIETGTTTIAGGIAAATERFVPLLVASILVGTIVVFGFMLLFIPGLIALFFLMFTFVSIMADGTDAVAAIRTSVETVKSRLSDTVTLFAALLAAGIVFGFVNMIVNMVPLIGQLVGMALMGIFGGYVAIVLVKGYTILRSPVKS